ncbi:MAG: histidine phosphatase family protein [Marinagarivorans sp.]
MAVKPADKAGIYLVRHLKPQIPAGICYGQSDVPAEPISSELHSHLLNLLPSQAAIFSSPLQRCSQLAGNLFPTHRIQVNPLLMELNFGAWEMRPWDLIPREQLNLWAGNLAHFAPPGGESFADLCSRVEQFRDEHLTSSTTNIIITHGGVIKAFYYVLGVLDLTAAVGLSVDFGSVHFLKNKYARTGN